MGTRAVEMLPHETRWSLDKDPVTICHSKHATAAAADGDTQTIGSDCSFFYFALFAWWSPENGFFKYIFYRDFAKIYGT
jgi:hypothetical protein